MNPGQLQVEVPAEQQTTHQPFPVAVVAEPNRSVTNLVP